jgi:hypothetical protein
MKIKDKGNVAFPTVHFLNVEMLYIYIYIYKYMFQIQLNCVFI